MKPKAVALFVLAAVALSAAGSAYVTASFLRQRQRTPKPLRTETSTIARFETTMEGEYIHLANGHRFIIGDGFTIGAKRPNVSVGTEVTVTYYLTRAEMAFPGTEETIEVAPSQN
jgi:hypothetical protein